MNAATTAMPSMMATPMSEVTCSPRTNEWPAGRGDQPGADLVGELVRKRQRTAQGAAGDAGDPGRNPSRDGVCHNTAVNGHADAAEDPDCRSAPPSSALVSEIADAEPARCGDGPHDQVCGGGIGGAMPKNKITDAATRIARSEELST